MISRDEGALRFRQDREEHIELVVPPDREGLAVGRNHHKPLGERGVFAAPELKNVPRGCFDFFNF